MGVFGFVFLVKVYVGLKYDSRGWVVLRRNRLVYCFLGNAVGYMAVGQSKVLALGTYGVTNEAADRTSPDRGK
ncbi:MAG: hypothetical protein RIS47_1644 [Bacteroidota bacterium]|jgi:hypothetical protein